MGKFDRKKLDNLQQAYDNLRKKSYEKTKIYGKRNAKVKSLKKESDELKQELIEARATVGEFKSYNDTLSKKLMLLKKRKNKYLIS